MPIVYGTYYTSIAWILLEGPLSGGPHILYDE